MPKAYLVVCYRSISDPQKLAAYAQLAPPAVAPFGEIRTLPCAAARDGKRPRRLLHEVLVELGEGKPRRGTVDFGEKRLEIGERTGLVAAGACDLSAGTQSIGPSAAITR